MALVYSCCFWFSLRLGGILIGIFSLAVPVLYACCLGYDNVQLVKDEITNWKNGLILIYAKSYLDSMQEDPQKYFSIAIGFTCLYIIACILFIYGAYTCNNILLVTYIIMELLRLLLLSTLVATGLQLIKQNTMDIGLLIGASVAGGFFLLGMFYLWLCAANLPIVINEIEREEQVSVIDTLRQVLEVDNPRRIPKSLQNLPFKPDPINDGTLKQILTVPNGLKRRMSPQIIHSRIPKPFRY